MALADVPMADKLNHLDFMLSLPPQEAKSIKPRLAAIVVFTPEGEWPHFTAEGSESSRATFDSPFASTLIHRYLLGRFRSLIIFDEADGKILVQAKEVVDKQTATSEANRQMIILTAVERKTIDLVDLFTKQNPERKYMDYGTCQALESLATRLNNLTAILNKYHPDLTPSLSQEMIKANDELSKRYHRFHDLNVRCANSVFE